ncbi:MAG: 3-phosphoshikimate 1-carboxyvinyltransferase [Fluviicola sp.]|nr:3-phosphoshikimate 1-carboxyvinyltransferase [Fluviicola sp.]
MMQVNVAFSALSGKLFPPPSKSDAQRAILCADLSSEVSVIHTVGQSKDVKAMLKSIQLLGAKVDFLDEKVQIEGIKSFPKNIELNVGESGLGLRLLAGIVAVHDGEQIITGEGSILQREQNFFENNFIKYGVEINSNNGFLPFQFSGKLRGGEMTVDGSHSSQYISGLLMGLPLLENDTTLFVENAVSTPYIDMTIDTLKCFGIEIVNENYERYFIKGGQNYQSCNYFVEADWSAASCWLVAAALSENFSVQGLKPLSKQADRAILYALELANCEVEWEGEQLSINGEFRFPFEFNATHCPDAFPALVALAAFCNGQSRIKGLHRLSNKESNRGLVLQKEFEKLGLQIDLEEDTMIIHGGVILHSAEVDSHNDHRIAMCLAIAGTQIEGGLTIHNAEAVAKSYPNFWEDLKSVQS